MPSAEGSDFSSMARAARKLSLIVALAASSLSSSVGAAPANKPAAEALFEDGRRLLSAGRVAEACSKFEASQELDSGVGTLLFLGDCSEQLGRYASAWAAFMEAASLARARGDAMRENIAATRAQALRAKVPRLELRVPEASRASGLTIRIGDQLIPEASWNAAIPVDPGPQRLEASAPGRQSWVTIAEIKQAGEEKLVVVPELVPKSASPMNRSERARAELPAGSSNGLRTLGIVTGGAGLLAVAVGSVLGLSAQAKNEESLDFCPRSETLCSARGKELRDEARGRARAATAAFVAGGVLLGTGIVLFVAAPSRSREGAVSERAERTARFKLELGARSGGVELEGHF